MWRRPPLPRISPGVQGAEGIQPIGGLRPRGQQVPVGIAHATAGHFVLRKVHLPPALGAAPQALLHPAEAGHLPAAVADVLVVDVGPGMAHGTALQHLRAGLADVVDVSHPLLLKVGLAPAVTGARPTVPLHIDAMPDPGAPTRRPALSARRPGPRCPPGRCCAPAAPGTSPCSATASRWPSRSFPAARCPGPAGAGRPPWGRSAGASPAHRWWPPASP